MARLVVQSVDRDGDFKQISIPGDDAATNGSDYAAKRAAAAALLAAIQAIQVPGSGAEAPTAYWAYTSEDTVLEPDAAVFPNSAQVNTKWQIEYIVNGVAAEKKHVPIPIAYLDHADAVVQNGRIEIPIGTGDGATLVAAFEAFYTTATVEAIFHDER